MIADYAGFVQVVRPASIRCTVANGADDDAVLACALAATAELIVSGDAHPRNLKRDHGIPSVPASDALAIITRW